ncbi:MAG: hypothetical protein QXR19_10405 [Candidatus Jordarchaeaceae archaeon]
MGFQQLLKVTAIKIKRRVAAEPKTKQAERTSPAHSRTPAPHLA